jgi:shikimate kinase
LKIFLLGYMGSGKTTVGRKLAGHMGYSFLDMDTEIEKQQGMTINQVFEKQGEAFFRSLEHELLLKIFNMDNLVISTGGGVPCFGNNLELINKNGVSVYLRLTPEILTSRLRFSRKTRPLINELPEDELLNFVHQQLEQRESWYLGATLTCNALNMNIEELAENISTVM